MRQEKVGGGRGEGEDGRGEGGRGKGEGGRGKNPKDPKRQLLYNGHHKKTVTENF